MEPEDLTLTYNSLMRWRARTDLFYLLTNILNREDVYHQWLLDRINEVQANPNARLDLWSREHYKSTIITFGLSIQDILRTYGDNSTGEEYTIGIFSYVRPIAKDFLIQIKREFENNDQLKELFPDIFYTNPQQQAPKWSDEAIVVKRKGNPKESSIEAWGVFEGQPTGRHFSVRLYDDMVTHDSVKTEDRIKTTLQYWELSLAMGDIHNIERYIGTRYAFNDVYHHILDRKGAIPRIIPATHDGSFTGLPVFWTQKKFDDKVRTMGQFTAQCQLLQNPVIDSEMGFKPDDIRYYAAHTEGERKAMSRQHIRVILVDPSSGKGKKSDFTAMGVFGLGTDDNYYLLDAIRDKLSLSGRTEALFELHERWKPKIVGYEEYGLGSDIEHIEEQMDTRGYHFDITKMGGSMSKRGAYGRIARLQPVVAQHRLYFPKTLPKRLANGRTVDLIRIVIDEEIRLYPSCLHEDFLDMTARLLDPDLRLTFPSKLRNQGPKHIKYPQQFA